MRAFANFLLTVLAFLVFCVLGIALGAALGYGLSILRSEGLFTPWRQLEAPVKFTAIRAISLPTLWAEGTDGRFYSFDYYCFQTPDCQQWIKAKNPPLENQPADERLVRKSDSCDAPRYRFMRKPPGRPVDCASVDILGIETLTVDYFALLEDGSIWRWEMIGSQIDEIWSTLFCWILGLILGITSFMILFDYRSRPARN
jgi:hypothetical protein